MRHRSRKSKLKAILDRQNRLLKKSRAVDKVGRSMIRNPIYPRSERSDNMAYGSFLA